MSSILGVETLQHTNGTTAATIDSSGNVDFPQVLTSKAVAFSVYHNSAASIGSTTSYTKLPYNSTNFDSHSAFNFTNDQYVVPVAGIYYFNMSVLQLASMASNISFFKNGTYNDPVYRAITGSTEQNVTGSIVLDCNVNDTVDVRIKNTNGSGSYYRIHGGFHGFLIG